MKRNEPENSKISCNYAPEGIFAEAVLSKHNNLEKRVNV